MARYNQLRTLAFRLNVDTLPHHFASLGFPEKWKTLLRQLQSETSTRSEDKASIPIHSLNGALRALVPDLISIRPDAGKAKSQPWLFCVEPIPSMQLFNIIQAWMRITFAKVNHNRLVQVMSDMSPQELIWRDQKIDLAQWNTGPNGTATPTQGDSFVLFPDWLASRLSQPNMEFSLAPEVLHFRRSSARPGEQAAELISWPPLWSHENQWPFSYVMTLSVQTVPFQRFPVVHCDISIRRWASPKIDYSGGKETSVYLMTSVPWIAGLHHSPSFQVASLRWEHIPESERTNEANRFRPVWSGYLAEIVQELRLPLPFPNPQDLLENPRGALETNPNCTAAIVFRNGMSPEHGVAAGVPMKDRRRLADQIAEKLLPNLIFTDPPIRAKKHRFTAEINPFFEKAKEDQPLDPIVLRKRRLALTRAVGREVVFEIWYQSALVRDALVSAICSGLGLSSPTEFPNAQATNELKVTIRAELLGDMGSSLPSTRTSTKEHIQQVIRNRISNVGMRIQAEDVPIASFIELGGKQSFTGHDDPKFAIRMAFATVGRLTQFITPGSQDLSHRAEQSFHDILRQLGVILDLPCIKHADFPNPLNYVGLWLITRTGKSSPTQNAQILPVMVHVRSDGEGGIQAVAPGLQEWLPYRQVLIAIGQGQTHNLDDKKKVIPRFVQPIIERDIVQLGNTLLFCHAQNFRSAWSWLTNNQVSQDSLSFGQGSQPISKYPGLRIVRMREYTGHETPEWYAQNGEGQGFASGLFQMGERVFASTYGKPHQFRRLSRDLSKVSRGINKKGQAVDPAPGTYAWNPGLVELTIPCLQPGDDVLAYAAQTHRLRHAAMHYNEATTFPLPLHLAELMKEYALSLDEEETGDE
jgi:hypothetical protein